MMGDKYELLEELNFPDEASLAIAVESVKIQEEISNKVVEQFVKFINFFSMDADIQIHNGDIMAKVLLYQNNAGFINDDGVKFEMNMEDKKTFSRLILRNLIAAYQRSKLDVLLEAPFYTNNVEEWTLYLKVMRYVKIKFDFKDNLEFGAEWFLDGYVRQFRTEVYNNVTLNSTMVEANLFKTLDEVDAALVNHTTVTEGEVYVYQDMQERYMTAKEFAFQRELEQLSAPVDYIYEELYEYKTQQLSFFLQQILVEEIKMAREMNLY